MKKFLLLPALVLLIVSCATTEKKVNFSEKEASYALSKALDTAITKSLSKTDASLTANELFIPESCIELNTKRADIAGMNTMLENWSLYAVDFVLSTEKNFEAYIHNIKNSFVFDNPIETVLKGNSSATEAFLAKNGDSILEVLTSNISNMDTSLFEKAVNQYNLWARANNLLDNSAIKELDMPDIRAEVGKTIFRYIKSYMLQSEELFRTTPSADVDSMVAKVFGLE